tara:strand:+ start:41 stop:454 length:414 start_codon:yes stop_codon:yes gene_type:complete
MKIKNNPIKFAQSLAGAAGSLISGDRSNQSNSNLPIDNTHTHSKRGGIRNNQKNTIETALDKINGQIVGKSMGASGDPSSEAMISAFGAVKDQAGGFGGSTGQVGGFGASPKPNIQSLFGGMGGSTMSRIASMFGRR